MPELPEVETIRRDLVSKIVNKKIKEVKILDKKVVEEGKDKEYKNLKNLKIITIIRQGKLLAFLLENKKYILIHLKMTGQLVFKSDSDIIAGGHPFSSKNNSNSISKVLPDKHTRFIIYFSNGSILFFNDIRRFGYVKLVSKEKWQEIKESYGPEPLKAEFKLEDFKQMLSKRKTSIKAVLLNQKLISGLGNIYVDESLFMSNIDPRREAKSLKDKEVENLFKNIVKVLKLAIKNRGTTFSDYVDGSGKAGGYSSKLLVFGRDGDLCGKCGSVIKKVKVAGRGTHICEKCQK